MVAVTGAVGSGKSALTRALLAIYPIQSGTVALYAADGSALDHGAAAIGYLPQDAQVFSGSIRDNVLMGAHADDQAFVAQALEVAALDTDIAKLALGIETPVGELGVRLSGGQRQRLGLARAIAAYAPQLPGLLVLDDPFSSVDVDTEKRIVSALREAFGPHRPFHERATILLCSQRLAAFPHADRVVVLENGRVEEEGRHDQLIAREGLYARIYRAQACTESSFVEGTA
jgi:ABC-type multidrug transport system fused ATPase/permease subunit